MGPDDEKVGQPPVACCLAGSALTLRASATPALGRLVIVTEIMTGGTLKQYIARCEGSTAAAALQRRARSLHVRLPRSSQVPEGYHAPGHRAALCRQILRGIAHLHAMRPTPIIHRDLKCDNIFVDGSTGNVKIGDLGLARRMTGGKEHFATEVGRAARCALRADASRGPPTARPDALVLREASSDARVHGARDVRRALRREDRHLRLRHCVLEMVTGDYPYRECATPAQVYRKVGVRHRVRAHEAPCVH